MRSKNYTIYFNVLKNDQRTANDAQHDLPGNFDRQGGFAAKTEASGG